MIACICVPYFAAAVERRAAAPLAETPLAIGGQPWEAKPIFAFSQEVARQGVKAGMSLRLAHVLSPEARFLPAARPRYRQAAGEIADVLLDFAPVVEPQEAWAAWEPAAGAAGAPPPSVDGQTLPARYFLDFDTLPPAESLALAREMGRFLRDETRFAPALGLAAGRFAAGVAATLSRPNHATLVAPGEEADFLARQPIAFLPLEVETARRLRLLGIATLGGLARLPRAALVEQFGPAIAPLHRLARGRPAALPGATAARGPAAHESAEHVFDPPLSDRLVLAAVVRQLAARLAERLATTQQAAAGLYLAWETEDGRRDQRALTLRRPSAEARHLTETWLALGAALGGDDGDAAIARLTLGSRELVPAAARQMSLFDEAGERARRDAWAGVRALVERFGGEAADVFLRPAAAETDHPLPERRFQWARP